MMDESDITGADLGVLCIGSVLWDTIGRTRRPMAHGADVPGRITRLPGGVALNIAMTLGRLGLRPALLSTVGRDAEGDELLAACAAMGLETRYVHRSDDLPTDRYMAIEAGGRLVAAMADAHSLEAVGARILAPLTDGTLGSAEAPYPGLIALDGNLTEALLTQIAESPAMAAADLRVAPASPGKAQRLSPFVRAGRGTLYVNLEEAGLLCATRFTDADQAARALVGKGAERAIVTNGGAPCCDATQDGCVGLLPPPVEVTQVTGAGDTFMAAHMVAEHTGAAREAALAHALDTAARYVSGGLDP